MDDFVSGHVQTVLQYWKETILTTHPQRDELSDYIGGSRLSEFIDPESAEFKGADATPIELPNHVPASRDGRVDTEIESLVQKDSLASWSTVVGTKVQPRPRICLPFEVKLNKPRLIWDAWYLHHMCKRSPFQMDGVGKDAQCSWKGAQQVILDHKSGFHNVPTSSRILVVLWVVLEWSVLRLGGTVFRVVCPPVHIS